MNPVDYQIPAWLDAHRPRWTGWAGILRDLHEELLEVAPDYIVFEIKVKFGELRIQVTRELSPPGTINPLLSSDLSNEDGRRIRELLDAAADRADEVCFFCGQEFVNAHSKQEQAMCRNDPSEKEG